MDKSSDFQARDYQTEKTNLGTAILYPKELDPHVEVIETTTHRFSAIKIKTPEKEVDVLVISAYLPVTRGVAGGNSFCNVTDAITALIDAEAGDNTRIIVVGDVNVRTHNEERRRTRDWMKFLKKNNLTETRTEGVTHRPDNPKNNPSTLDTISVDKLVEVAETRILDEDHFPNNQSDHYPLQWDVKVKRKMDVMGPRPEQKVTEKSDIIKVTPIPDWEMVDKKKYREKVHEIIGRNWDYLKDLTAVLLINTVGYIMAEVAKQCLSKKKQRARTKKSMVSRERKVEIDITKISNVIRHLEKIHQEESQRLHPNKTREVCEQEAKERILRIQSERTKRRSLKALMTTAVRARCKAKIEAEQTKMMKIFRGDKNKAYAEIERLKGLKRSGLPDVLRVGDEVFNREEVLNGFAQYAAKQSTSKRWEGESLMQNRIDETIEICRFLSKEDVNEFNEISSERFEELLSDLPAGKGGDLQGLQLEHIKNVDKEVRDFIRELINEILPGIPETYSDTLLNTRVATMIYKGKQKPKDKVSSYRRVSIGSIFQKIIDQQVIKWMGRVMIEAQSKRQFGFTEKLAINQCVILRELAIQQSEEFGEPLYILAADVSQAFSSTERSNQLFELLRSGEDTKYFDYSDATYRNTTVYMKGGKEISMMIVENIGAPQGGKKSAPDFKGYNQPLIRVIDNSGIGYSLMIHRGSREEDEKCKPEGIEKETFGIILVADDSLAMATSEAELMAIIHAYEKYAEEYFLDFAFSKVILNVYGDKKALLRHKEEKKITINGHQPIYADESVHLGTIVCADPRTTNRANIQNRIKATNAKLFHLLGTAISTKKVLNQELQREAYLTYIRSALKSTLECFPFKKVEMKILEDYEKKILRNIFKYHKSSKIAPAYLYLGMVPIDAVIHMDVFSLFHNIWATKDITETASVCRAFMLKEMKTLTWPTYIRDLADMYGIIDPLVCLDNPAPTKEVWSGYVKKRIFHYHESKLKEKVNLYNSTPFMNVNGLSLRNKPSEILLSAVTPYESQSCNVTLKHLTGDYLNAVNFYKGGTSEEKQCKLCQTRGRSVEEDSLHNLAECPFIWEDDRVKRCFSDYVHSIAAVWREPIYETWRVLSSDKNLFVQMILDPLSENLHDDYKIPFTDLKKTSVEDRAVELEKNQAKRRAILAGQKFVKVCDETRSNLFKRMFNSRNPYKRRKGDNNERPESREDEEHQTREEDESEHDCQRSGGGTEKAQGNHSRQGDETRSNGLGDCQVGEAFRASYDVTDSDLERATQIMGRPMTFQELLPLPGGDNAQMVAVIAGYEALAVTGGTLLDQCEDTRTIWKYGAVRENQSANKWSGGLMILAENEEILANITLVEGNFERRHIIEWKEHAGLTFGTFVGERDEEKIPATLVFLETAEEFDLYHAGLHDSVSHHSTVKKLLITTEKHDVTFLDLEEKSPFPKMEIIEMSFGTDKWFRGRWLLTESPRQWVERVEMFIGVPDGQENLVLMDLPCLLNQDESSLASWTRFMVNSGRKREADEAIVYMIMMSENLKWPTQRVQTFELLTSQSKEICKTSERLKMRQSQRFRASNGEKMEFATRQSGKKSEVQIENQPLITNFASSKRDKPNTMKEAGMKRCRSTPDIPCISDDEDMFADTADNLLEEEDEYDSHSDAGTETLVDLILQTDGADDTPLTEDEVEEDEGDAAESSGEFPSGSMSSLCSCFGSEGGLNPNCPARPYCDSWAQSLLDLGQTDENNSEVRGDPPAETSAAQEVCLYLGCLYGDRKDEDGDYVIPHSEVSNELEWKDLDGAEITIPESVSLKIEDRRKYAEDIIRARNPGAEYMEGPLEDHWANLSAMIWDTHLDGRQQEVIKERLEELRGKNPTSTPIQSKDNQTGDVSSSTSTTKPMRPKKELHGKKKKETVSGGKKRIPLVNRPCPNLSPISAVTTGGKRKETPGDVQQPMAKRSDCSYSGYTVGTSPTSGKKVATTIAILHPGPSTVRHVQRRPRTISEPSDKTDLIPISREDLMSSTRNATKKQPEKTDQGKPARTRITFGDPQESSTPSSTQVKKRYPATPANTPTQVKGDSMLSSKSRQKQKKSEEVSKKDSLSPEDLRKKLEAKGISVPESPEVINVSSSSSDKSADGADNPNGKCIEPSITNMKKTGAKLLREGDVLKLMVNGHRASSNTLPEASDSKEEKKRKKSALKMINAEGRLYDRVFNNITQAEKLYAGITIDYLTNEIWDINDELRKENKTSKQLNIDRKKRSNKALGNLARASVYYQRAIEDLQAFGAECGDRKTILELTIQQEQDLYIIAYHFQTPTSMAREPDDWRRRQAYLKENLVRAIVTDFFREKNVDSDFSNDSVFTGNQQQTVNQASPVDISSEPEFKCKTVIPWEPDTNHSYNAGFPSLNYPVIYYSRDEKLQVKMTPERCLPRQEWRPGEHGATLIST